MKPKRSIRRFDVFAEYQRLKALAEGEPQDMARGSGLWLAKLVAARKFGRTAKSGSGGEGGKSDKDDKDELVDGKWRTLSGEPQTDAMFEKEIVQRMGEDFYRDVFEPAVRKAFKEGKKYEEIRDSIRADWKTGSKA